MLMHVPSSPRARISNTFYSFEATKIKYQTLTTAWRRVTRRKGRKGRRRARRPGERGERKGREKRNERAASLFDILATRGRRTSSHRWKRDGNLDIERKGDETICAAERKREKERQVEGTRAVVSRGGVVLTQRASQQRQLVAKLWAPADPWTDLLMGLVLPV